MQKVLTAFLLLASVILSQELPVFRANSTIVTVPCTVTDAKGQMISNLQAGDFRLFVDGSPQEIHHFWTEAELPFALGVINDISDSQRSRVSDKERALTQLLERIIRQQDRAFVVAVNDKVILKSEVTSGPHGLHYKLLAPGGEPLGVACGSLTGDHGRSHSLCGGTALWNAVYAAAHYKLSSPGRNKALLILSDGIDTGSTHSFAGALEEVQRSGTVVYAIRYPDALNPGAGADDLHRLTEETGGVLYHLHDGVYSKVVAQIADELQGRYVIGFRPTVRRLHRTARHQGRDDARRIEGTVTPGILRTVTT